MDIIHPMTKRLYEQDPYLREFTAVVRSCEPWGEDWAVELDRTCFYPEGGGQPGDVGTLEGVPVRDTRERDGKVLHRAGQPLEPGRTVRGEIDWDRRFDLMQQHTGEHMVSGVANARFGCRNVGFHMGAEAITIDFDRVLTWEQLEAVEAEVNRRIWEDLPVRCWYPAEAELETLSYRSKKALTGAVRVVEIPGVDLCACCGTHVARTGEIGLVKLLNVEKFHSGIRIELVSGRRAYGYLTEIFRQNRQVSRLLSVKPLETARGVEQQGSELEETRRLLYDAETARFRDQAERCRDRGDVALRLDGLTPDGLRRAAAMVQEACGGRAVVFSGDDSAGYRYAAADPGGDLRPWVKALNAALRGRGGGKPNFVQGALSAGWDEISAYLEAMDPKGE